MKVSEQAPGKLFLAGEYAVTHLNQPALLLSVDRYLTVTIETSESPSIFSDQVKEPGQLIRTASGLRTSHPVYNLVVESIGIAEGYVRKKTSQAFKSFSVTITSQLDDPSGLKYGLGSSGAVTIATIKAVLSYYDLPYTPLLVYKLGVLTHLAQKSLGSFGDLAASAFEGLLTYQKPDTMWLLAQQSNSSLIDLVDQDWPSLAIQPLTWPSGLYFLAGWTGSPASTEQMVADLQAYRKTLDYQDFLTKSKACVTRLISAFQQGHLPDIMANIRENRQLLQKLSPHIETEKLQQLCNLAENHGASAKVSGAGGGDCGICFLTNPEKIPMIQADWQKNQIKPLFEKGRASC